MSDAPPSTKTHKAPPAKVGDVNTAPETTAAEDMVKAGQRAINMIWETTQMKIALSVIWGSLLVGGVLSVFGKWVGSPDVQLASVVFMFGVANLVTGFYFGRTNHTKSGGVGEDKPIHDR